MCLEGWPAVEAEYHNPNPPNTPNTRRYRGISYTTPINAAKETVPVIDLADRLIGPGGMRRVGKEWAGRCPLPDHPDRSPSFTVNPQKNLWWCFGCLRGSDVVELYRLYHGYDQREAHTAAAMLLMEFGHEPPARPATWHRKQERQKPARDGLEQVKVRSVQRRLMRIFGDYIAAIEDPKERREEAQQMWRDLDVIARLIVKGRRR